MNIIKRIGIALHLVLIDAVTKDQAKWLIENYRKEFGEPMDNHRFQELQRRSEKLAYIEGCGYELKQPSNLTPQMPVKPDPEPVGKWKSGKVMDGVLRSIDKVKSKRYTAADVWLIYRDEKEPETTRQTILATISYLHEKGLIQLCNPPRKIGNAFVYEKQ